MYLAIFSALTWLSIPTISNACTIMCPPNQIVCVGPNGMNSTCGGFKGCHEICPPGTVGGNPILKGISMFSQYKFVLRGRNYLDMPSILTII